MPSCCCVALCPFAAPASAADVRSTGRGCGSGSSRESEGGDVEALAERAVSAGMTLRRREGGARDAVVAAVLGVAGGRRCTPPGCGCARISGRWRGGPALEARVLARAVGVGADCVVIDAEIEYQGKYAAARSYMRALRRAVGPSYPGRADVVPVRRPARQLPVLRLPRGRWRAVQPAADVLAADRDVGRGRVRADVGAERGLRAAGGAARAVVAAGAAGGGPDVPVDGRRARCARRELVGVAARDRPPLGRDGRAARGAARAAHAAPGVRAAAPRVGRRPRPLAPAPAARGGGRPCPSPAASSTRPPRRWRRSASGAGLPPGTVVDDATWRALLGAAPIDTPAPAVPAPAVPVAG